MRRDQLEHVVSAAAAVAQEDRIVVVGSQAILGTYPDAPETLLRSMEADVYPLQSPEKAEQVDGAMGDGSPFHRSYGYFAHGVGPETAKPPAGWESRLVAVKIPLRPAARGEVVALCLEPHDLVLAKCAAGRDRDWEFARDALDANLVDLDELLARHHTLPIRKDERDRVAQLLRGLAEQVEARRRR